MKNEREKILIKIYTMNGGMKTIDADSLPEENRYESLGISHCAGSLEKFKKEIMRAVEQYVK